MNEFQFISPLTINLAGAALKNLAYDIPQNERYSYIFQGNAQVLDHIFVSEDMCPGAVGEYIHVNAEFAYSDAQASDHDPMVACITLPYDD
jgi:predicted extracellular nuclease